MVKVREYRRRGKSSGMFEVDLRLTLPTGDPYRERIKVKLSSKTNARRWGESREAEVLILARQGLDGAAIRNRLQGKEVEEETTPTLEAFWPRFMDGYARANQEKPSTLDTRERIWRTHLRPMLAALPLDAIDDERVQQLKAKLSGKKTKTVNNVLTNLNKLLKVAVEWKVISAMPCRIRQLKTTKPVVEFYEPEDYEKLVAAAAEVDDRAHIAVLLGGDAGLRLGEILGVEWADVDWTRKLLKVQRAVYDERELPVVTLPKGGKPRIVPMTARLHGALQQHRHLRGARVLYQDDGSDGAKWWLKWMIAAVERRAGLRRGGRVHILRHTFCSRLAARNVPMLTIKDLAGHVSLETTMRYMHLSAAAPRQAIEALEAGVEALTAGTATTKENG